MLQNQTITCTSQQPTPLQKPIEASQRRDIWMILLFFLLLFVLNSLRVFVLLPWEAHLNDLAATLLELGTKGSIWIGLPFLFLTYGDRQPFFTTIQMKGNIIKGLVFGILGSLIFGSYLIYQIRFHHTSIHLASFTLFKNVPSVCAGFIEEIAFRGYLLYKLQRRMPFFAANGVTAALFVIMHIPLWLATGTTTIAIVWYVFVLALILGLVVAHTRSLWSSVIMHTANNVAQLLLGV